MPSAIVSRTRRPSRERGIVLIIALVMLVVISLLATFSIRAALSNEAISGNVRTTQLASQAAEVALRYCEDAVINNMRNAVALPAGVTIQGVQVPPLGVSTTNWDATRTGVFVLPSASVNLGTATFSRMPECVIEQMRVGNAASTAMTTTSTFLVTARGFGPEVAGGTSRPDGSEVWLQSTLEVQ
jgi:type IV pilus assembly protein PilX